ncbi:hypothetical protein HW115_08460 [Verrucomicrobiaceae bacterium N1E253]|uniref:Uncharacterized protein n=1 Tax=Oceaniferula marina TaxID=2748318 RepID=A0A851GID9_9BACT|nr:hypothetical protein [Oceaniferula marina]NWK55641.1 hypothetical protein [Oceaniferula marina]
MAVKLIANYSKRLGLPGYSSHQFSVSVETELNTTDDIAYEAERLYHNLQTNVDGQIQQTGFVPPQDYGMETPATQAAPPNVLPIVSEAHWQCSPKQQELILKLISENSLDKGEIEQQSRQRFRKGVKQLNKLEASGLIEELFEMTGANNNRSRKPRRNAYGKGGA